MQAMPLCRLTVRLTWNGSVKLVIGDIGDDE
jgi:hypothetical protein